MWNDDSLIYFDVSTKTPRSSYYLTIFHIEILFFLSNYLRSADGDLIFPQTIIDNFFTPKQSGRLQSYVFTTQMTIDIFLIEVNPEQLLYNESLVYYSQGRSYI